MAASESALLHAVSLVCTVGASSLPIEDSPPNQTCANPTSLPPTTSVFVHVHVYLHPTCVSPFIYPSPIRQISCDTAIRQYFGLFYFPYSSITLLGFTYSPKGL